MLFAGIAITASSRATEYNVGDGQAFATIGAVPWESLAAGDVVRIHWRAAPYHEKWVITAQGTSAAPIVITGVLGPNGERPIIDGANATTRQQLDYWSEGRGIVKVGGSSIPADVIARYITIENLEIRGARSTNSFTDDGGATQSYGINGAAIYLEKGENITIRNCEIHDCGNGLFVSSSNQVVSRDILIDGNYIYGNGNVGSAFEHNTYTAALNITYQYNRFGPLLAGASGNALKDRSAGLVVRYNWIESGNRQLDLVDAEDSSILRAAPEYHQTYVYGNLLIEPDGAGNSQITHYGGDSGATNNYRKGTLFFYNNTVVSTRATTTTLFRLSTNGESCDARNNIFYVTAAANQLALVESSGTLNLSHNWFKPGWKTTHGTFTGTLNDDGTAITGTSPGFVNEAGQDFHLTSGSAGRDAGTVLNPLVLPANVLVSEYVKHQSGRPRATDATLDLGAFEFANCTADIDHDGDVDLSDLGVVLAAFGCTSGCGAADVDGDGDVDLSDLGVVLAVFGGACG